MTYCSDMQIVVGKGQRVQPVPKHSFPFGKPFSRVLCDVVYKRNAHMNLGLTTDVIETLATLLLIILRTAIIYSSDF